MNYGDLLPCPFCGQAPTIGRSSDVYTYVLCRSCTLTMLADRWNKRAPIATMLHNEVRNVVRKDAEFAWNAVIDDCNDWKEAWKHARHAMNGEWP